MSDLLDTIRDWITVAVLIAFYCGSLLWLVYSYVHT